MHACMQALKMMRASVGDFEMLANSPANQEFLRSRSDGRFHVATLGNAFEFRQLLNNLCDTKKHLEDAFVNFWTTDSDAVCSAIEEACPKWTHVKQTLLSEPVVQKAMLDNINIHYSKIGPLANELKKHLGLVRDLHKDGRGMIAWLGVEYVQPKEVLADTAIETVAYTYLLWHLLNDVIPSGQDLAARGKKIEAIDKHNIKTIAKKTKEREREREREREAIETKVAKEHRVALTDQMKAVFTALKRGEVPEDMSLHGVPAAPIQQAQHAQPLAVVPAVVEQGPGTSVVQQQQVAAPRAAAEVVPTPGPASSVDEPPATRRLADRLRKATGAGS